MALHDPLGAFFDSCYDQKTKSLHFPKEWLDHFRTHGDENDKLNAWIEEKKLPLPVHHHSWEEAKTDFSKLWRFSPSIGDRETSLSRKSGALHLHIRRGFRMEGGFCYPQGTEIPSASTLTMPTVSTPGENASQASKKSGLPPCCEEVRWRF